MAETGATQVPNTKITSDNTNVFINCPYDEDYVASNLRPLVFVILFMDFKPRLAMEILDSGQTRMQKIIALISESKFSIHDLSRLQANKKKEIFRLNMAFELGLDMGARIFSGDHKGNKKFLVLEKEKFMLKKALSDFDGFDYKSHNNLPEDIVRAVRDWLAQYRPDNARSVGYIWEKYNLFMSFLYDSKIDGSWGEEDIKKMQITDFMKLAKNWIEFNR